MAQESRNKKRDKNSKLRPKNEAQKTLGKELNIFLGAIIVTCLKGPCQQYTRTHTHLSSIIKINLPFFFVPLLPAKIVDIAFDLPEGPFKDKGLGIFRCCDLIGMSSQVVDQPCTVSRSINEHLTFWIKLPENGRRTLVS